MVNKQPWTLKVAIRNNGHGCCVVSSVISELSGVYGISENWSVDGANSKLNDISSDISSDIRALIWTLQISIPPFQENAQPSHIFMKYRRSSSAPCKASLIQRKQLLTAATVVVPPSMVLLCSLTSTLGHHIGWVWNSHSATICQSKTFNFFINNLWKLVNTLKYWSVCNTKLFSDIIMLYTNWYRTVWPLERDMILP